MSSFERFPNIEAGIITALSAYSAISNLVGSRIYYPSIPAVEGGNVQVPLIQFERAGGDYGAPRYLFRVRADDVTTRQTLLRALLRRLESPFSLSGGENLVETRLEGFPNDSDETVGFYESSVYVIFELLEAGYG